MSVFYSIPIVSALVQPPSLLAQIILNVFLVMMERDLISTPGGEVGRGLGGVRQGNSKQSKMGLAEKLKACRAHGIIGPEGLQ